MIVARDGPVCADHAITSQRHAASIAKASKALLALGRKREAVEAAAAAEALAPRDASVLDTIGGIYTAAGEHSRALRMFERAVAAAPTCARYHFNLAATLRFCGYLDRAESVLDRLIELSPGDAEAYWLRSGLRRQTAESNHIASLERALLALGERPERVALHYALGKEYEDQSRYDRAFECFKEGADLKRRHMSYDVAADIAAIDGLIEHHTSAALARMGQGLDCAEPIFVVGMPRSGSTLVERILTSHSQVVSIGESPSFTRELLQLTQMPGVALSRQELILRSLEIDAAKLGREYLQRSRPEAPTVTRFVDKLPLNFLYCGLIRAALPRAKIVHVVRDPMDACYAMYKTLFSAGYPFSYDLTELGRYYVAYRRLMSHWRQTMPAAILEVRYEDVVADTTAQTRRMLAFCDLPMETECVAFHLNPAATTTASAAQVRQPIYHSSVGKWRYVEKQLAPLWRILQEQSCLHIADAPAAQ